jgi:type I restriction enzyme R subunit
MVDHFHEEVIGRYKIGGMARAMVVCNGINRAILHYYAFNDYLKNIKSPYKPIVAFSGEHEYEGVKVTESSSQWISSSEIPDRFQVDPYRFLIVADKFQTGFDEPLLHTMYVDKPLDGIKAVQTLSRLNRAHPKKTDTFILDFANKSEYIREAFDEYYRTTVLSDETDPNKLHNLKADLDRYQVYTDAGIDHVVACFLKGESRELIDPVLDACVVIYNSELDENGQVDFKGKAKSFVRTYNFLSSILPYATHPGEIIDLSQFPCSEASSTQRGRPFTWHS